MMDNLSLRQIIHHLLNHAKKNIQVFFGNAFNQLFLQVRQIIYHLLPIRQCLIRQYNFLQSVILGNRLPQDEPVFLHLL